MKIEYALTKARRDQLYGFYFDEWWTQDRTHEEADRALGMSHVVLVIDDGDNLAGFARVVSDGVFFAWVGDVIVSPSHRGRGLGVLTTEVRDGRACWT